ncbi:hypothetical protein ABZP36_000843 [Zizania latifolia]
MHLTLEFGGGLELLLEKSTKVHKVDVQPKDGEGKVKISGLLSWVKSNLIKERPEMFLKGDSVRPGVLVLINDCDWEICGGLDAELEEKDVIIFISTLHGGFGDGDGCEATELSAMRLTHVQLDFISEHHCTLLPWSSGLLSLPEMFKPGRSPVLLDV